jgi:hypothetical protein
VSVVRPEFGPTLPELLGPRWRALPRALRVALGLAVAVVVLGALAIVYSGGEERHEVVVRGAVTFNLVHPSTLERVEPRPGELLRLQRRSGTGPVQSYTVSAVRTPAYRGDINGFLPLYTSRLLQAAQRRDPAFALRGEGRVRVNDLPGYGYVFQTRVGGRTTYGRRLLLFPDEPGVRVGADVLMLAERSPSVPSADAVGNNGALKTALRSLRFGTERP